MLFTSITMKIQLKIVKKELTWIIYKRKPEEEINVNFYCAGEW